MLQFSRRDDLQNNDFDPTIENRRLFFGPLFLKLCEARRKEAFHIM